MKAVCLISNDVKDFVAAKIVKEKGYEIILVHFYLHSKDTVENVAKKLKSKLYLIDLEKIHEKISESKKTFSCGICKRVMLRVAEKIAEKESADVVVIGEDLEESKLKYLAFLDKNVKIKTAFPLISLTKKEVQERIEKNFKEFKNEQKLDCPFESKEKIVNINTLEKLEIKLNLQPVKVLETAEIK